MPVPYTTYYDSGVEVTSIAREDDRLLAACACKLGSGLPKFGEPCPHRQRRAMAERRCVTCGRRISERALAVFLGLAQRTNSGAVDGHYVSLEPPAHPDCAAYSALVCPHLADSHGSVRVGVTRTYQVWQQEIGGVDAAGKVRTRAVPPGDPVRGGFVDLFLAVLDPARTEILTLDEWLATRTPKHWRRHLNHGAISSP